MAGIKLSKICKTFDGGVKAVDNFDLDIEDKEFIVFVGPSGCGKSTTLRMIAGLEEISSGELFIDGRLVNDVAPKDRDIAMVFQNYALYPHMTVYGNMAFALKLRNVDKASIDRAVRDTAAILGIEELLSRKPKALSGGQRQRVAIGRAIVRNPKAFLMDEPLSNLDAKLRNQMRTELIKLHKRLNTTFVYVTHDQVEAMTLGNRIVVMKDGKIQQCGTPREIFNVPANLFVANFIGTPQMNCFEHARLILDDGLYCVELMGKTYRLPDERQRTFLGNGTPAGEITVGIRPEDIVLARNKGEAIRADIDVLELMGSEYHAHVRIKDSDGAARSIVMRIKTSSISEDENLDIAFLPESMHVFDQEKGGNLIYGNEI